MDQGFFLFLDVINEKENDEFISALDQLPWNSITSSANSRKTQHYGYEYSYSSSKVTPCQPLPDFLLPLKNLLKEICEEQQLPSEFDQCIVNNYEPGQGISKHIDSGIFGEVIACFILGSGSSLILGDKEIYVPKKSLYLMTGESRYNLTHMIPARKSDMVNGKRVQRGRRISVTFRSIRK